MLAELSREDDRDTFFRTAAIMRDAARVGPPRRDQFRSIVEWVTTLENAWRQKEEAPPPFVGPLQLEIEALGDRPTPAERYAEQRARELAAESQHFLDTTFDDMQRVVAASAQMKLKLPKMNERARTRDRLAEYIKRVVTPHMWRRSHYELADRLLDARQSYLRGFMPDGKIVFRWSRKAGLPLLCPDDAREEAMRLSRRMVPNLLAQLPECSAHYAVLTWPNAQQGTLREVQAAIWKKFTSLMRACKRRHAPFPIVGAVAVMESPLGAKRTWHPHLNVMFIVQGDWLDYEKLRARWHYNMEIGKIRGDRRSVERSFRELVKYACRAVPEKSEEHAARVRLDRDGNEIPPAPAMTDWHAREFLEFVEAHRRHRRTRSYQSLYGLPKPTKLDFSLVTWDVRGERERIVNSRGYLELGGFVERSALLESIPGDNSTILERWKAAWMRLLGPPDHLERVRRARRTIERCYGPVSLAVA